MKTQGYVRLIHSVDTHTESVLELSILPGEKTPWHYHTLFAEYFKAMNGLKKYELDLGYVLHVA